MAQEHKRKAQLVEAALAVVGETGSLEVPVGKIAKRAGVSSALAFHYFGDKESLFLAAMRQVLRTYSTAVRKAYRTAHTPSDRLDALVGANFEPENFRSDIIATWLNFYVMAYRSEQAKRLLLIYHARLRSNLLHGFRPLIGDDAEQAADRIASLIDGLYLRYAHNPDPTAGEQATAQVRAAIALELQRAK
ncbi:transcriptional regulator BetI [Pseudoprimorskyibacter insulae]|uniref:HTH-type transcriptional regulator BetI n=1 Tax=Pseudoprimorskyibacter insulae TaxID=1695997 RepID=A0A2R8ANX1_9RHOB|nr:transcriptional regulator BetI [Pseudoprimorskyibacter insulae]SPF77597.1 HTH-type transcriptional regulator BetI [Pseudoprimorskyibacter insulae]